MPKVGIRELKARASEIMREVREQRARYVITYHGRPIGVLLPLEESAPVEPSSGSQQKEAVLEELDRLGAEIGCGWQSPLSSAELLSEMRR